jgi:protein TonB
VFDHFSGETLQGTRQRLIASLAGAGAVYAVLGVGAMALFAHYAVPAVEEEKAVDVKFVASAPPPPPPPPPTASPEPAQAPPPPPPKSRPPRPNEVLPPPPKPISAPKDIPAEAPTEADPSQETGPPPSPEGAGEGDPFGQRGGTKDGQAGGKPGGTGTGPATPASDAPVVLPPGATPAEPVDSNAKPEYPRAAIEARFTGEVVVKVIVHTDGHVEVVKIVKSDPNFDATVLAFLKTYRMKPAVYNGKPIAVFRNLRFPFRLD